MDKIRKISTDIFIILTVLGILYKSIPVMYVGLVFKLYADYQTRLILKNKLLKYELIDYFRGDQNGSGGD